MFSIILNFIYRLISDHLTIVVWSLVASLWSSMVVSLINFMTGNEGVSFIIRVGVFILICAVGYGWLSWLIVGGVCTFYRVRSADPGADDWGLPWGLSLGLRSNAD